ncbi:MAG: glycosyltransferase [Phycisphaerales bacterium]
MTRNDVKIHSHRPRIVMLLANSFLHDTRVYKEARSLIEWGCEVHVVALCNSALPTEEEVDGIYVHRVPMRHGDVARLGAIIVWWWSRPVLRWLVGSPREDLPKEDAADPETSPEKSRRASIALLRRVLGNIPGSRWTTQTVLQVFRRLGRITARVYGGLNRRVTRVVRAITRRSKRVVPPSLRLLAMNLQFTRHAIDLQPYIVQSHDLNTLFGGTLVKRLTGAPLVYDSHELFLKRNIGNKSRARDNLIWAPVERFCIGKCDAVLSVAEGICDYLAKQYGISKPHLIRNVQPFEPPGARTTVLADELGIPADRRIVIYPGAITINRGLEVMIDSAPYLNGAAYVIMGYARNADYLASLKQRATKLGVMSSSIFFREAVPIDDVVRYVASADLGIVPTQNVCLSYFFESSNKIFHCVMAGVPVAMSDHREKRLLVEEYGIGALFDETDPKEIARVVNETLDDREAYNVMRRNCLEAARVLNWEHEEYKLRQIFADLLGDRAAPIPQVSIEPVCTIRIQSPSHPHYVTTK